MKSKRRLKTLPRAVAEQKDRLTQAMEYTILFMAFAVPLALFRGTANIGAIKDLIFQISLTVLLLLWSIKSVKDGGISLNRSPIHLPLLLFVIWNLALSFAMPYKYASLAAVVKLIGYALFYLVIATAYPVNKGSLLRLLKAVLTGAFIACVYGMLQRFGIDWLPWDKSRILSTLANPTFFAAYLILLLPITVNIYIQTKKRSSALSLGVIALLMFICLLYTYTRAACIGLFTAMLIDAFLLAGYIGKRRESSGMVIKRALMLAAITAVAGIVSLHFGRMAVPEKTSMGERFAASFDTGDKGNAQRLIIWKGALGIIAEHPLTGTGPGTFQIHYPAFQSSEAYLTDIPEITDHAHNELLELLAETGAVGLLLFLWITGACLYCAIRAMKRAEDNLNIYIAAGLICGLIAFMIQNMAGVTMRWVFGAMFFWLMAGLIDALSLKRDNPSAVESPKKQSATASYLCYAAIAIVAVSTLPAIRSFASEMHLNRGRIAMEYEDYITANRELTCAINLNRYSLASYYKLGHVQNMQGSYAEAFKTYRKLEALSPYYARIHYNLGAVLSNMGRYDEAIKEYSKALQSESTIKNRLSLAQAYASAGMGDKALREADESVRIVRAKGSAEDKGLAYLTRGDIYYQTGDLVSAIADVKISVELNSKNKAGYFILGNAFRKTGSLKQAADAYEHLIKLDPNDWRTLTNLGVVYASLNEQKKAETAYEAALKINPNDLFARFNLGVVHLKTGDISAAREEFSTLAKDSPDSPAGQQAKAILQQLR